MKVATLLVRITVSFYWRYSQSVFAYQRCQTIITDPLEWCTNLFSQDNFPKSRFDDLKDPTSRSTRRKKHCNMTLSNLYKSLSSKVFRRDINRLSATPENMMDLWAKIQLMKNKPTKKVVNITLATRKPPKEIIIKGPNGNIGVNNSTGDNSTKRIVTIRGPSGSRGMVSGTKPSITVLISYNPTCNKLYFASVVDLMPFSYQMMEAIGAMFKRCCGDYAVLCSSTTLPQMSYVNRKTIANSEIVFPVLARSNTKNMHGYHFLPVYDAPSAYYFSKKPSKEAISNNIAVACGNLWPLLTVCLILALISGFVAWAIETRVNEEEFPRAFHVGLFEGFWWSFISMTTVGYGDKAPKTIAGRGFSIIWILVGITVCSMFTASLTTEITRWTTPLTPTMSGKQVGALKSRLLDGLIVAKHRGIIKEVQHNNVSDGIDTMIQMLNNGTITGFVLDTVTYHYFVSWGKHSIKEKKMSYADHFSKLFRSDVSYEGDKLSFGVLFKNKPDISFFQDYFSENQLYLEACYNLQLNAKMAYSKDKTFLFDPAGGMFYTMLYWLLGLVGAIVVFGTVYELRRKELRKSKGKEGEKMNWGKVGQTEEKPHCLLA